MIKERGAKEAKELPDPAGLVVEQSGTPHERLVDALWSDGEERVRCALADGADPNGTAHGDEPVLGAAMRLRKASYVRLLLETGADPNTKDESGKPLMADWVSDEEGVRVPRRSSPEAPIRMLATRARTRRRGFTMIRSCA